MVTQLNDILSKPDGFPMIPATRKDCQILHFPAKKRNDQYVMCPEQECESLVYHADQSRSMIEVLGLEIPSGKPESKPSTHGIPSPAPRLNVIRGHGKAKTVKSGQLPRALPSELKAFQPIQQIVRIHKKKDCDGKTLVRSTSMSPSCIPSKESDPPCPVKKQNLSKDVYAVDRECAQHRSKNF